MSDVIFQRYPKKSVAVKRAENDRQLDLDFMPRLATLPLGRATILVYRSAIREGIVIRNWQV